MDYSVADAAAVITAQITTRILKGLAPHRQPLQAIDESTYRFQTW